MRASTPCGGRTEVPGEIIVADDGSGPDTRSVVERHEAASPCPLHHVWHPDEGFRLGGIRNKAMARAAGDYIVSLDGDMVCHPALHRGPRPASRSGLLLPGVAHSPGAAGERGHDRTAGLVALGVQAPASGGGRGSRACRSRRRGCSTPRTATR